MDCSRARDLIPQYCSGELDDDTRRQVEEHISDCSECRTEMEQERSLGCVLGESVSDDPPAEYWNDYNAKVRSRIRGAFAMSWRMGCLPGCLAGLIFGFAEYMGIWGLASSNTSSPLLETIKTLCLAVGFAVVVGLLLRRFSTHGLPRYEQDETSLKHTVAMNPLFRRIVLSLFVLLQLGVSAFLAIVNTQSLFMPEWAGWTLRVLVFMGFASIIPGYRRVINDYLDGRDINAEWARKSIKQRVIEYPFFKITLLLILATFIWQDEMLDYVNAPFQSVHRAKDLFLYRDTQSAVSILKSGIRKYGDSYRVLVCYQELGDIYERTGHPAEARDTYRAGTRAYEYLITHPKFYHRKQDRLWLLGDAASLYIELGDNKSAFEVSAVRLQMDPDDAENIYFVASDYYLAGYEGEAKVLYTRITVEFPNSMWAESAKDDLKALY